MPGAAPCTCGKKCRGRGGGSLVFLGLFLLSLSLHAITLVCYLDLRSEVKREIIHQKRDSVLTLSGGDLADPAAVLSLGPPRPDSGGRGAAGGGGEVHEVKTTPPPPPSQINNNNEAASSTHCFHSSHGGGSCSFTSTSVLLFPDPGVRFCARALSWHVSGQLILQ